MGSAVSTSAATETDDAANERAGGREAFLAACGDALGVMLQPVYRFEDSRLYAVEALMSGAEKVGAANPHALLDRAYELDALHALELEQIRRALVARANCPTLADALLFLNVDGRILNDPRDFVAQLDAVLSEIGASAQSLVLEVSERHDRTSNEEVTQFLRDARSRGFLIAIDDVGVGVADLQALAQHRFDYVKIDRYFVDGVGADARLRFFVASIVELTRMLGARVVVEGVENEADFFTCRDIGCDLVQGFLIGRPTERYEEIRTRLSATPQPQSEQLRNYGAMQDEERDELNAAIAPIPAVPSDAQMQTVLDLVMAPAAPAAHPVVDAEHRPVGLLHFEDLRRFLSLPYGIDLMRNSSSGSPSVN